MTDDTPTILSPSSIKASSEAGAFNTSASHITFHGKSFDVYDATLFRSLAERSNREYFPDFFKSYHNNTYTSFACDYLYNQILDGGWRVEGAGSQEVRNLFALDDTYEKINYTMGPVGGASTYGIGLMDLTTVGGRVVRTRPLNPLRIGGRYDTNRGEIVYHETKGGWFGYITKNSGELNKDNLFINTLHYDPYEPFPIAPLRSSILLFTMLYDMNGDIAEAIKRVAYAPFVIYVNTDGVDEDEKDAYMRQMSANISNVLSASTNLCLDDRHKAGTAGSLGGGGGAQLLPVDSLMVPILSIALTRFGIPLGLLVQGGANKSILDAQMESAQRQIVTRRNRFRERVDSLLSRITNKDVSFEWQVPLASTSEMRDIRSHYLELLEAGVVDHGYVAEKLDVELSKVNLATGGEMFEKEGVIVDRGGR